MVIEVADTTLKYDTEKKLPRYARFGITEVWIVDLNNRMIEVHSHPDKGFYCRIARYHKGQQIRSTIIADLLVDVDAVME